MRARSIFTTLDIVGRVLHDLFFYGLLSRNRNNTFLNLGCFLLPLGLNSVLLWTCFYLATLVYGFLVWLFCCFVLFATLIDLRLSGLTLCCFASTLSSLDIVLAFQLDLLSFLFDCLLLCLDFALCLDSVLWLCSCCNSIDLSSFWFVALLELILLWSMFLLLLQLLLIEVLLVCLVWLFGLTCK